MPPPSVTYTEEQLIALLQSQSRDGFNYLYENYGNVLFGVIKKVIPDEQTCQDVLQESFVKIWNNIRQFDPGRGRLYTWMLNICRNAAIDKLRSKGEIMKGKIHPGEGLVDETDRGMRIEQQVDAIGLRKMVGDLKPEYQVIVELAYFNGFTLDEISKTLGIPLGTVKTRMRYAIRSLRQNFVR